MLEVKKQIKERLTNLAKKNLFFRRLLRKCLNFYKLAIYKIETFGIKVDDKTVIFSCFNGKSYSCSPKAIYEYMLKDERFKDYKFVWVFKEKNQYKEMLEKNSNTIVVKSNGNAFRRNIARAKYWVFNYKLADYLKPKKNQVFIQCWHGTPLKRLGMDLNNFDSTLNTVDEMKKRYKVEAKKFSYFISPSKYATEKFVSAWNLREIGKENIIIEEGYPRNDFLFQYTQEDIENIKKKLFGYYFLEYEKQAKKKKIILYAPTYRANQHETGKGYVYKEEVNFNKMRELLGEDYIVLFRSHYFIANQFDFKKYEGFVYDVSRIDDINELYIISDILITDYSSVFFDYANLKKPIIFYMYDLDYYRDESNGFYIDIEKELPGQIVKTDTDLINEIQRVSNEFVYDEKYKKFNEKYNYLDDGQASQRVVNIAIK